MQVTVTETIQAPLKKVFEYFSDIEKAPERINGIQKIEILSDQKSGVGLKWRETRVMFGKEATEEMWISELDAPNSYSVEAASHGMKYHTTYTFTEDNGTTTVAMVFSGTPVSLMSKLTAPLFGLMFKGATKKALRKDMQDLKKLLER